MQEKAGRSLACGHEAESPCDPPLEGREGEALGKGTFRLSHCPVARDILVAEGL